MYKPASEVMVFNMVSTYVNYRDEGMFYVDLAEILSFCIDSFFKHLTSVRHNLPYNYKMTEFKDESWLFLGKRLHNGKLEYKLQRG